MNLKTNDFIESMKVHYSPEDIFIKQPLNISKVNCKHCSSTIKDATYTLDMQNFIFLTRYGGLTEEGIFHLNTNFCSLECAKKELEVITGMSIDNFLNLMAQNMSVLKQLLNNAAVAERDLTIEEMIQWYKMKNEGCTETNLTADMLFFAESRGYRFITANPKDEDDEFFDDLFGDDDDDDESDILVRPYFEKMLENEFRKKFGNITDEDLARYHEVFEPYDGENGK